MAAILFDRADWAYYPTSSRTQMDWRPQWGSPVIF